MIDTPRTRRYLSNGVYLDAIRQGYEAFVVWSFQELLTEFLHNKAIRKELVRGARTHSHHHTSSTASNSVTNNSNSTVSYTHLTLPTIYSV